MSTFITQIAPSASTPQTKIQTSASVSKSTQTSKISFKSVKKSAGDFSLSLLAKAFFGQSNFDFLDVPTQNLKITQAEVIADLR